MGLVFVFFVCLSVFPDIITGLPTIVTNGESGELCGAGPYPVRCLTSKAECVGGTCLCTDPKLLQGKGSFACYRNIEYATYMMNDPTHTDYNGFTANHYLPCRVLVTHVTTALHNKRKEIVGTCQTKVHAYGGKDIGKFYMRAADFAIEVTDLSGDVIAAGSFLIEGEAANGTYTYRVSSTDEFAPDGPWFADEEYKFYDSSTGLRIRFQYDGENNYGIIFVKKCGVRLRIRLFDLAYRRSQTIVPGIGFGVNTFNEPINFLSIGNAMALVPVEEGGFDVHSLPTSGMAPREKFLLRALTAGVNQVQEDGSAPMCAAAISSMSNCLTDDEKESALSNCMAILMSPVFIRCYDETTYSGPILELFSRCDDVIEMITMKLCHHITRYPAINQFVAGDHCPTP